MRVLFPSNTIKKSESTPFPSVMKMRKTMLHDYQMIQKMNADKQQHPKLVLMKMVKPTTWVESQTVSVHGAVAPWLFLRLKNERVNKISREIKRKCLVLICLVTVHYSGMRALVPCYTGLCVAAAFGLFCLYANLCLIELVIQLSFVPKWTQAKVGVLVRRLRGKSWRSN